MSDCRASCSRFNSALELMAVLLNINRGYNEKLKGLCKSLKDYSEYTARVREYAGTMPISEAVEQKADRRENLTF